MSFGGSGSSLAGGPDNQVHFEGYQVSNQCMALVRDECLLPCKDAPELGYVKESSSEQYVPDVFYKVSTRRASVDGGHVDPPAWVRLLLVLSGHTGHWSAAWFGLSCGWRRSVVLPGLGRTCNHKWAWLRWIWPLDTKSNGATQTSSASKNKKTCVSGSPGGKMEPRSATGSPEGAEVPLVL